MSTADFPVSISALVFPSAAYNFSKTLSSLKRSRLSVPNRLSSILDDSNFVSCVASANDLPLIANERCGSWYVPLERKAGSVYFKSTDGHQSQWKFSTRRLNLQLLDIIGRHDGCIIVDSTRRGKSMPDALSKTVPIWCAVMNRLLFPDSRISHELFTAPHLVSASEHVQIYALLGYFLDNIKALQLDTANLTARLQKPLRPVFVTQATENIVFGENTDYHRIICCSASKPEQGDNDSYIQGAGDDTENWAFGLTAEIFWKNVDYLRAECDEEELQGRIVSVTQHTDAVKPSTGLISIHPAPRSLAFHISNLDAARVSRQANINCTISCGNISTAADMTGGSNQSTSPYALQLDCFTGKLGSRSLRDQLPRVLPFMRKVISNFAEPKMLFACKTGRDLSVGVALTVLCLYYDDQGQFITEPRRTGIHKSFIRQRLAIIMANFPDANPARATLQSVNSFLMERP